MQSEDHLFSGSIVALVTPMLSDGAVDIEALKQLVEWHIVSGTQTLVIMGTTGESALVSMSEHLQAVEVAISQANHRINIIAGCGSVSTNQAITLVKSLNVLKPDGFLCVTPYYIKPTQNGLMQHFSTVADSCDSPLLLYNVPDRSCCDLLNKSVVELALHDNIIGIKDATGDIERLKELKALLGDDFCYLSGDDSSAFDYILAGGQGLISVTGNIAPKEVNEWCRLLLTREVKNEQKAKIIFDQLMPLNQVLFIEANPIPVKWALAYMKKIRACIQLPLTLPEVQSQIEIKTALKQSAIDW